MVEQIEVFRGTSHEDVASQYNNWMMQNDKKVKKIIDFYSFTEYLYNSDNASIPVGESVKVYYIQIRYESTLAALTS